MHLVANALVLAIIDHTRANGHACADLFDGLSVEESEMREGRTRRVPWNEYLILHRRMLESSGGVDAFAELLATVPAAPLDWALRTAETPTDVYRVFAHVVPLFFGLVSVGVHRVDGHTARISCRIAEGSRDVAAWLASLPPFLAALPSRAGLPATVVQLERIELDNASWLVRFDDFEHPGAAPPPVALTALAVLADLRERLSQAQASLEEAQLRLEAYRADNMAIAKAGAIFMLDREGRLAWANDAGHAWMSNQEDRRSPLEDAAPVQSGAAFIAVPLLQPSGYRIVVLQDPGRGFEDRLSVASGTWSLTPAQGLVLREIVRGLSNKEIAAELGNAEATVEVHVSKILRKSGASGRTALVTRFWSGLNET